MIKRIIPEHDLLALENARVKLYKLFPDLDPATIIELHSITAPMWKVANKKYPIVTDSDSSDNEEKIRTYEAFLHKLQMFVQVTLDKKSVSKLISNACDWSYAHRVGNGQYSDREQQAIIDKVFKKLTDT